LNITFEFQNCLCPSYLSDLLNKKVLSRALNQLVATVLQPLNSNCVVDDRLLALSALDCGMTFRTLFLMVHKSAPRTTIVAPHCVLSFVLILRRIVTPACQLARLLYKLLFLVRNVVYTLRNEKKANCIALLCAWSLGLRCCYRKRNITLHSIILINSYLENQMLVSRFIIGLEIVHVKCQCPTVYTNIVTTN